MNDFRVGDRRARVNGWVNKWDWLNMFIRCMHLCKCGFMVAAG